MVSLSNFNEDLLGFHFDCFFLHLRSGERMHTTLNSNNSTTIKHEGKIQVTQFGLIGAIDGTSLISFRMDMVSSGNLSQ